MTPSPASVSPARQSACDSRAELLQFRVRRFRAEPLPQQRTSLSERIQLQHAGLPASGKSMGSGHFPERIAAKESVKARCETRSLRPTDVSGGWDMCDRPRAGAAGVVTTAPTQIAALRPRRTAGRLLSVSEPTGILSDAQCFLRRLMEPTPARPRPRVSSESVSGSGTDEDKV